MDDDDRPIGRILSRREVLALLGGSSVALLAACTVPAATSAATASAAATAKAAATGAVTPVLESPAVALPSCIVRPALTEGPYFVDEKLDRSDIRSDPSDGSVRPGIPLSLIFNVSQVASGTCASLAGALVDVWHCDAAGVYSDASDPLDRGFSTKGKKFLRGYQTTGTNGLATFTTIYPGWYQGRAVHIHFKIRTAARGGAGSEFTSQLFFDEATNDAVLAQAPYARGGQRLRNDGDSIYRSGGEKLLLTPIRTAAGYAARFDIGLA